MQQEQESTQLCLNGCGFFGNATSGGMCSVCWKKHLSNRQVESDQAGKAMAAEKAVKAEEQQQQQTQPSAEATTAAVSAAVTDAAAAMVEESVAAATVAVAVADGGAAASPTKLVQKNKKRCWECKKKVGLTAIECRCGYVFCNGHRYADQHNCDFDFKAADRAELARRNPGGGQFGKLEKL